MPSLKNRYRNFTILTSLSVIMLGVYVLIYGTLLSKRIFGPELLGNLPIATDSAACFIIMGISLACLVFIKPEPWCTISKICSIVIIIWCALLLVRDFTIIPIPLIFGMSPQTAFCFICLSVAIFFIHTKKRKYLVQALLHIVTIVASIVIIGHIFNIPEFYKFSFIPMAIYTAIGFVLISIAASLVNPSVGITGLFTGNLIGNLMARRLFFKMFVAILVLGFIRIFAHRQHWVSVELGSAVIIVAFLLITLGLIWRTSHRINKIDIKRKLAIENFTMAVQAAPYALIISDKEGTIRIVNDRTRKLYGYTKEELLGKNLAIIIPEKMHHEYMTKMDSFFRMPRTLKFGLDEELTARRKNGSEFPIELTFTPVRTSAETYMLATIVDITQRKTHEDTIKKQLIELQIKNEELEQFNYISSHDLQEPLRTMSNYIHMLEEDYPEQLNEEMKEHLNTMDSAINRMSHVVRSLLEFGKLGRKKKLVLTDCNKLVSDVEADLNTLIKTTGAKITVTCGLPKFYAYEAELRQLFQNLIANAVKFQKGDIPPEINISSKKKKGFHEFSVADNGIGIDPKYSEKIFHIFHRLNTDEHYEGHGIGLANCKKIAEMHGGQIWVESQPGKGSTFKFTILNFKA